MTGALLFSMLACGQLSAEPPAQGPGNWVPSEDRNGFTWQRSDDMVLRWNEIALQAVRAEKSPPPIVSRTLAMMHVAIHDAVNSVYRTHSPFLIEIQAAAGVSPEAAVAAAAHRVLAAVYPGQRERLRNALMATLADVPGPGRDSGVQVGEFVADRVMEWRQDDGSKAVSTYQPRLGLGLWRPTPAAFQAALLPEWGKVKTFALRENFQSRPPGPPALGSPSYVAAYREVRALGGKVSDLRTPEQTKIALFWADDLGTVTPPGHWNQIAQSVVRARGTSLAENARIFALLNVSLADAAILCWWCKFSHDFWRPVTAIQMSDETGNPDRPGDPSWMPLLNTPPFPSYTSGHSTFSAAAASVLAQMFGDQVHFETASEGLPGWTRTFPSFSVAAAEAGQSRVYGGIHWQFDNTDGLANGWALGEYVVRYYLRPK